METSENLVRARRREVQKKYAFLPDAANQGQAIERLLEKAKCISTAVEILFRHYFLQQLRVPTLRKKQKQKRNEVNEKDKF